MSSFTFPRLIPRGLGDAVHQYPAPGQARDAAKLQLPGIATSCHTLPGPGMPCSLHISLFPGRCQPPRIGGVSLPHSPSWHPGHPPLMARLAGKGNVFKLSHLSVSKMSLRLGGCGTLIGDQLICVCTSINQKTGLIKSKKSERVLRSVCSIVITKMLRI